jgi:hypothetical protein
VKEQEKEFTDDSLQFTKDKEEILPKVKPK